MSTFIKPTVGRIVWYWDDDNRKPNGQPLAAIVTYVRSDRLVNLQVMARYGASFPASSIPLVQEGETPGVHVAYCEWMPYQKGQAAKADAQQQLLDNARHYDVWRKQTMEMGLPVANANPKDWEPIERLTNTGSPG